MNPEFFKQCAATAEHLAKIAKLQLVLQDIYNKHRAAMTLNGTKMTAADHHEVMLSLEPYLNNMSSPPTSNRRDFTG